MSIVKDRMLKIVDSLPENYFDNKSYTEMILMLMKEYLNEYGEDETTIIPGTDKHFTFETLKETLTPN
jgi:hypothetical protein